MVKNKILIIDDDEIVRKSLERTLTSAGFEVITAEDGASGLKTILSEKPNLILTDVVMPKLGGMEMIKELRNTDDYGKKVPIIVLTNFDTDEKTMQDIIDNKPAFYFIKTKIEPTILVEKIKEKLML